MLAKIETAKGSIGDARIARAKAIDMFLAFRKGGGENHEPYATLTREIKEALGNDFNSSDIRARISNAFHDPMLSESLTFLDFLQQICNGEKDRTLAEDSRLTYAEVAELLLLIEAIHTTSG